MGRTRQNGRASEDAVSTDNAGKTAAFENKVGMPSVVLSNGL